MQDIEQNALQTYEKNLEFFSKNHVDVLNKIQALNSAIENTQYAPKYDLEYVKDYFDVKELSSGNYLYSKDSMAFSKELLKLVNYDKSSYIFDGFPLYYQLEDHMDELGDKAEGLEGIFPIMTYYIDNTTKQDQMKAIEKFIFIGVGLGMHIPMIHQKIQASEYLIIEDDLELFNLSLFCTSYYELDKDISLKFSIAEDENTFVDNFSKFVVDSWFLNKYLKYSYFPAHSHNKIKLIQNVLSSQDFVMFQYKTFLKKQLRPLEYINNGHNIVNLSNHFKDTTFSEKPALVLASGPSLQKNLQWVKDNHAKFVIVAVSSSLKILYENNITPDMVIHLDGFNVASLLFENIPIETFLKNAIMLFGSFAPKDVVDQFTKGQCFFFEEDTFYFDGFSSIVGSCVGSTAVLQSIILDFHNIYLIGLDFAIDSESGRTHSSGHVTTTQLDLSKKDALNSKMSNRENLFPIKGNVTDIVYTNSLFHSSLQNLYVLIPNIKKDCQNIYNLSNGAKINKTIPISINDIRVAQLPMLDKNSIHDEIYAVLLSKSSTTLSEADMDSLQKRVEVAQKIKSHILEYQRNVSSHNVDSYLYDSIGIISKILHYDGQRETNRLVKVYNLYFKYALPIIMDLLNTKGLKNTKRHIKKLDKLFVEEMLVIEDIYEKTLVDFISTKV